MDLYIFLIAESLDKDKQSLNILVISNSFSNSFNEHFFIKDIYFFKLSIFSRLAIDNLADLKLSLPTPLQNYYFWQHYPRIQIHF